MPIYLINIIVFLDYNIEIINSYFRLPRLNISPGPGVCSIIWLSSP